MICTISPSIVNVEESHNTLKFAARVKKVVTKAQTNQVMDDKALLEKYRREISELKAQLTFTGPTGAGPEANAGSGAEDGQQKAELSTLLEKERMKHEEEMVEMNMVRNALTERIGHLTKLILTSQTVGTAAASEMPAARYTVETSADGSLVEFPKEIESRLVMKDAVAKEMQMELQAQQEKVTLMKQALEKIAKGEQVDIEQTLTKAERQGPPREKRVHEKRSSIASMKDLGKGFDGADTPAQRALRQVDEEPMDTPWNREELLKLRKANRELEIIVIEQDKKLEDMVAFENSDEFSNIILEMEQQREMILSMEDERDVFKRTIREMELKLQQQQQQIQSLSSSDASGKPPPSSSLAAAAARMRELEAQVQNEKQLRSKEQQLRLDDHNRNMARISSLEADLREERAKVGVHNLAAAPY